MPAPSIVEEDPVDFAPSWLSQPASEEKMRTIETWLVIDGPRASPLWRIQGELELNIMRLQFAQRDLAADETDSAALASRLRTARAGLERVAGEIDAAGAQRRRALDGVKRADKLLEKLSPDRLAATPVIARAAWGAARANVDRMDKNKNGYTRITVHHSADPNPVLLDGSSAKSYEAVREIQKAHMQGKNTHYGDIGYHFVIDPYGRVIEGRELAYQGAHAYGDNNVQNIGICLIGNFDERQPTPAALDALQLQIETLRSRYGIGKDRVYGHRELRSTDCPGKHLMRWVEIYRGSASMPAAKQTSGAKANDRPTAAKKVPKPASTSRTVH